MPEVIRMRRGQQRPTFLGIDLGTSSAKAVVTDASGAVLARARSTYPVETPFSTWSETDPDLWWMAITSAVREATAGVGGTVCGIGLSGQMHGLVTTDPAMRPVRPAITWADSRAVDQLALYLALPHRVRARLANPLAPGMAGPLLVWLMHNEPSTYRQTRWAVQPKDWVRSRLTGRVESEPSDASATLLYDVLGDGWDDELVGILGLDPKILPPLLPHSGCHAGTLLPAAAEELGLPPGTPVAAGAADSAAAVFGTGLRHLQAQITIGTGAQIIVPLHAALPRAPGSTVTHLYRDATPRGWYEMAAVQSGGLALSWVTQVLGASWAELYDCARTPVLYDDPIFLPHLTGERTPYLDPTMRGAWTGLDAHHHRTALLRSALEGVAFTLAEAMDSLTRLDLETGHVRIAGGGSTHAAWQQMLADILGRPLSTVHVPDASGRGAALLGACAAGYLDETAISSLSAPEVLPVTRPNVQWSGMYADRRQTFQRVLHAVQRARAEDTSQASAKRSYA